MNKRIILVFTIITLSCYFSFSQNSTYSPYSRYGFGDLSGFNGKFMSMGGTSIGIRSNAQLNFHNPASFTSMDTLSFAWEFGLNGSYTKYSTETSGMDKLNANINSIGVGFPVTGWWYTGVGLMPFSSVGYDITKNTSYTSPWGTEQNVESSYTGSGGISQVVFTNAFKINKNLSFGLNVKYLFGTIDHKRVLIYLEEAGNTNPEFLTTVANDQIIVSDFIASAAAQYIHKFNNDNNLTIGVIFGNETGISAYNKSKVTVGNSYNLVDTIYSSEGDKGDIIMPLFFGAGVGYQYKNVLFAADYETQFWSNSTFLGLKDSLSDMSRLSFGVEYIPNARSIKYLSRVNYRAGIHTANTYLNLNGEQLKDYGISFGFGLPVKKGYSMINIAYEYGKRGTIQNNLIKENYSLLSLSISLHDIWFVKRKFD